MISLSSKATIAIFGLLSLLPAVVSAQTFQQKNLVTDDQSVNKASITDPNLKNAWGMSFSATSPFWVSDNGTGVSTLYRVNPTTDATSIIPLVVSIPGDGSVTGQVFNTGAGGGAFNKDAFLFVSEDGTISGWRGALGTTAETFQSGSSANVYKGSALASTGGHTYLYAANFRAGTVDVTKGDGGAPTLSGSFTDPTIPSGYAPFNIQNLGGKLYVTYAQQDGKKHDEVDGAGKGFVDVYDLQGNLLGRVGSGGTLDAPWGLAIAPSSFGKFAGDLLVGNFGDGTINAFNLGTDSFVGQLDDPSNNPLAIDGLWGLAVGNGGGAGSASELYFTAGPNGEADGLFGSLRAVPEPGNVAMMAALTVMGGLSLLRRRKK